MAARSHRFFAEQPMLFGGDCNIKKVKILQICFEIYYHLFESMGKYNSTSFSVVKNGVSV
jgi:hypothetical protein